MIRSVTRLVLTILRLPLLFSGVLTVTCWRVLQHPEASSRERSVQGLPVQRVLGQTLTSD